MISCNTGNGAPHLRDLGECEVKHGVRLGIGQSLRDEPLGNPEAADQIQARVKQHRMPDFVGPKRCWPTRISLLLVGGSFARGS